MTLARPMALFLFFLIVPVIVHALQAKERRPLILGLRLIVFAFLILALARPAYRSAEALPVRVIVLDQGDPSLAPEILQEILDRITTTVSPDESLRVIVAGAPPREVSPSAPKSREFDLRASGLLETARKTPSATADALRFAAGLIPESRGGGIVLVSDGRGEDVERAVAEVATRGLPLDTLGMGAISDRASLRLGRFPAFARTGSTIDIPVHCSAPRRLSGRLEVERDGQVIASAAVSIAGPGESQQVRIPYGVREGARNLCQLHLVEDDVGRGASIPFAVHGTKRAVIALVEDEKAPARFGSLAAALDEGFELRRLAPAELAARGVMDELDAVWLSDLPKELLPSEAESALVAAVERGLGLFVSGGPRSFGPGGYSGSELERILPLRSVQKEERRDPSATLVIIIDTSGSMSGAPIALAKEVARLALQRLKPHDKAGIVEFHGARRWAAPIQPASHAIDIQRALNRLVAGGGTVIHPAIQEAYYALQNVRTRTRHVLVITDGGVEQGDFEGLVRRMADAGMTVSTVLVGSSSGHSPFLISLSQWGRGRHYHAPDRFHLPEVLVKLPESSLLPPVHEGDFRFVPSPSYPGDDSLRFGDEPVLSGLIETEARKAAEVLAKTEQGLPLLARWRVGLGTTTAFASDVSGPWTSALARRPDLFRVLSNVLRDLVRVETGRPIRLLVEPTGDGLRLFAGTSSTNVQSVRVTDSESKVFLSRIPEESMDLRLGMLVGPLSPGEVRVEVFGRDGGIIESGVVHLPEAKFSRAVEPLKDRVAAWAASAGGQAVGDLEDFLPREASPPVRPAFVEFWRPCLAIALASFLIMLLIRRLPRGVFLAAAIALTGPSVVMAAATPQVDAAPQRPSAPPEGGQQVPDVSTLIAKLDQNPESLPEILRELQAQQGTILPLVKALRARAELKDAADAHVVLYARVAIRGGERQAAYAIVSARAEVGSNPELLMAHARLAELAGQIDKAVSSLRRALQALPESELAARTLVRIRLAGLLLDRKPTSDEGLLVLQESVSTSGGHADLHAGLSLFARLFGRPELLLNRAPRPGLPAFHDHLLIGEAHLRAGQPSASIPHFDQAVIAGPTSRDRRFAQERLIAAHRQIGTLSDLCAQWKAEKEPSPERLDALIAVLRELSRSDEALDLLLAGGEGLADPSIQREVIGLALESGRDARIEEIYSILIAREPGRVAWRSGLALVLLLKGGRQEAERVLRAALDGADDPKHCIRLAEAARDLSLDDAARSAAERAASLGPVARIPAELFIARLEASRGQSDDAVRRVQALENEASASDAGLAQIADAYEQLKREDEAIRVLQALMERSAGEDVIMRLAWLLEKQKKPDQALKLWIRLWGETKIEARKVQAEDRILSLGGTLGTLADLAIELEQRLQAGEGTMNDLGLVVKIYTRAHDPVAAVEILRAHADRLGQGEIATLASAANVYQHCDDYKNYEATLLRLCELDQGSRNDYLQQLVMGALERGRGRQVRRGIERLLNESRDAVTYEFAAGTYALIQMHQEAVLAYQRSLALSPDRIEGNLLLGQALKDAGRVDEALGIFTDIVETADRDDLFIVAIDGLLNLSAPRPILEFALRRVFERIAAKPDKGYLYEIAADLCDEVGRGDGRIDLTTLWALVAGERRAPILRELMELYAQKNDTRGMIASGRSLLSLDEEMPPDVFLELGEVLLRAKDLKEAERVFTRARGEGEFLAIEQRVAELYVDAGEPGAALRILRRALLAHPDDFGLLSRVGDLSELMGDEGSAGEDFLAALEGLLRMTPQRVAEAQDDPDGRKKRNPQKGSGIRFLHEYDPNADPFDRLAPPLKRGLIASYTPAHLDHFEARIEGEIREIDASSSRAQSLDGNLRLKRLLQTYREIALAADRGADAARLDVRVLKLFPKDEEARKTAINERLERGLLHEVEPLARELVVPMEQFGDVLRRDAILSSPDPSGFVSATGRVSPEDGALAIAAHMLRGEFGPALGVLHALEIEGELKDASAAQALMGASLGLGDRAAYETWFLRWFAMILDASRPPMPGSPVAAEARKLLKHCGPEARKQALSVLLERLARAKKDRRPSLRMMLAELGPDLNAEAPAPLEVLIESLKDGVSSVSRMTRIFEVFPPRDAQSVLEVILESAKEPQRYQLVDLVVSCPFTIRDDLAQRLVDAFRASRRKDRAQNVIGEHYQARRLLDARGNKELARSFLDVLVVEHADEAFLAFAKNAMGFLLGREDSPEELLKSSLRRALEKSTVSWQEQDLLNSAISTSEQALISIADQVQREMASAGTRTLGSRLLAAQIATARGRLDLAERELAEVVKETPDDERLRALLEDNLQAQGRRSEAARLRQESLERQGGDRKWQYNELASMYWELERPSAARRASKSAGDTIDLAQRISMELSAGSQSGVRNALLLLLASFRKDDYFGGSRRRPASSSRGLEDFAREYEDATPRGESLIGPVRDSTRSYFWDLALDEGREKLLLAMRRVRGPLGLGAEDELGFALARGRVEREPRSALIARLEKALSEGRISQDDLLTTITLAGVSPETFPESLIPGVDRFRDVLLRNGEGESPMMLRVADLYRALKRPERARPILRWILCQAASTGMGGNASAFDLLDSYSELFPEGERDQARAEFEPLLLSSRPPFSSAYLARMLSDQRSRLGPESALKSAKEVIEALPTTPSHPSDERLSTMSVLANFSLECGDVETYLSLTAELLKMGPESGAERRPSRVAALPNPKRVSAAAAETAARFLWDQIEDGASPSPDRARLAAWLALAGRPGVAAKLFAPIGTASSSDADRLLYVDLVRLSGDSATALEIELSLLGSRTLPIARAARVLDVLSATGRNEQGLVLARDLADYTDHVPALLMLLSAAETAKDEREYRRLLTQFEVAHPEHRELPRLRSVFGAK